MYSIRLIGIESFYTAPTAQDYLNVVLMFVGVLLFFRFIQWLTSGISKVNFIDNSEEHKVISPFLIAESHNGELFSDKKHTISIRVVALMLLVLVILTPLSSLLGLD
ncbi:MAG: hypothetical protein K0U54_06530 [Bacteroidetes bacterium]|nr:hypothetical protein [Bacteroidota bacterium]